MYSDDYNYYSDSRVRGGQRKGQRFFVVIDDDTEEEGGYSEIDLPTRKAVCPTCKGRGKHANPSIDSNGLTAEDFAQDPELREDYLSGRYDVPCYECGGANVVDELDEDRIDPKTLELYYTQKHEDDDFRAMQASERRMGS